LEMAVVCGNAGEAYGFRVGDPVKIAGPGTVPSG
jgi:hypothetical protein